MLKTEVISNLPVVDAQHIARALVVFIVFIFGALLAKVIYNVYFHPLSNFPGPRMCAATPIPYAIDMVMGRQPFQLNKLHEKYGNVVRFTPDRISFASVQGRQDIYGLGNGHKNLPKDPSFYHVPLQGAHSIISSPNNAHHARFRRALSHAFSEKAMREQEPLITKHINLFIQQLQDRAQQGPMNMTAWFNFITFDIIGDLSFGESFGCLETGEYHPWITQVLGNVKGSTYMAAINCFQPISKLVTRALDPLPVFQKRAKHASNATEKVNRRISTETDRADFMTYILRHQGKDTELTLGEMQATMAVLVVAGSETTATLLSFATYLLLKNPATLQKLTSEIRTSFADESEINMVSVNKLSYELAVLEESLRIQPPAPLGLPRVVPPGGDTIDGHYVPEGAGVSSPIYSISRHAELFQDPESFIPERWLRDGAFEGDHLSASKPFSVGPRDCIGKNLAYAEMRLILARLLWNFDLEPAQDTFEWEHSLKIFLIWDKSPLMANLRPVQRA